MLAARLQDLRTLNLLVELELLVALGRAFVHGVADPLLPTPRLVGDHPVEPQSLDVLLQGLGGLGGPLVALVGYALLPPLLPSLAQGGTKPVLAAPDLIGFNRR